jgi:hypothetical protein
MISGEVGRSNPPSALLMGYFICFFFNLDILFIYISNVIPSLVSPLQKPLYPPPLFCFYEGMPPPTYPLLSQHPSILLHWSIKSSQDQGPSPINVQQGHSLLYMRLEPLVPPCVHLIGGLVPVSSGSTGWFILLFILWSCKLLQLLGSTVMLLHWGPWAQYNGWLRASTTVGHILRRYSNMLLGAALTFAIIRWR